MCVWQDNTIKIIQQKEEKEDNNLNVKGGTIIMKKVNIIIVFMLMFIISLHQLSHSETSDKIVKNKTYSRKEDISTTYLTILKSLEESNEKILMILKELREAKTIIDDKIDNNIYIGEKLELVDDRNFLANILLSTYSIINDLNHEIQLTSMFYEVSVFNEKYIRNKSTLKIVQFEYSKQKINDSLKIITMNYIYISNKSFVMTTILSDSYPF